MNDPNRHHYIPVFYLRQWCGSDGRLCQYSRPRKVVKPKRKHPAATGYVDGLYTIPGLPPDQAQFVERHFMKLVDDWAAKALHTLTQPNPRTRDLCKREHVGWARFIYSLMLRNPQQIARFEDEAVTREYGGPVRALLPDLINSVRVIGAIAQEMTFHTFEIEKTKHKLLTSDRPIIMTNGLARDDAYVVMPISPTRLFIAVRNRMIAEQIIAIPKNDLVSNVNSKVAEQAIDYVYGVDHSQLRFIENRLGKRVPSTPLG